MAYEPIHVSLVTLFDSVVMSANRTSDPYILDGIRHFCVQVTWSGASAADGTTSLEASNDGTHFDVIPESVLSVSGTSGVNTINVDEPAYKYVRLVYTKVSSADGNMSASLNAKR